MFETKNQETPMSNIVDKTLDSLAGSGLSKELQNHFENEVPALAGAATEIVDEGDGTIVALPRLKKLAAVDLTTTATTAIYTPSGTKKRPTSL